MHFRLVFALTAAAAPVLAHTARHTFSVRALNPPNDGTISAREIAAFLVNALEARSGDSISQTNMARSDTSGGSQSQQQWSAARVISWMDNQRKDEVAREAEAKKRQQEDKMRQASEKLKKEWKEKQLGLEAAHQKENQEMENAWEKVPGWLQKQRHEEEKLRLQKGKQ